MTDEAFTAEERRWLAVWDDKRQQVAAGAMTTDDVREWVWQNKVVNAISVTIQRIKRSERPGRDSRRTDNTWVTVAAERGHAKDDASPLAMQTLSYVVDRLTERGHDFDVDIMATSRGLIVISINVKGLRGYMNRRSAAGTA
ncbi:MAG TPA: hypothetical protein PKW63_11970 [Vicinamibacterales bacterium]|nr:hypothetical protein [Acidobacteriota bacterium]HQX82469.1 hypothetical protein [Vicinamibacterales bacterium]